MHVLFATPYLQRWTNEGSVFLSCIVMVDESWLHLFDAELKWQNAEWYAQMSLMKKIYGAISEL
jgi:hypothetical protein